MEWTENGILLSTRRHGESSLVASVLTETRGRHAGLIRGGAHNKRLRGVLEPGNTLRVTWRGRLAEHLGTISVELVTARAAVLMSDPLRLAALHAACSLAEATLPEREPHPACYEGLGVLLDSLIANGAWQTVYVKWEMGLLGDLGFGLDLSACAASGVQETLIYVSPKSGRAVSEAAGRPYRDKLLRLPEFLGRRGGEAAPDDVLKGLELTGYFLQRHVREKLPDARSRLLERLRMRRQG